uniref:Major allergen Pru ar 1-like n=1 Tax=Tanacetum cinerariifolium TaxID=118510 RepID=A0A6L2L635_TANCI|nr:major allergen Pru ar 1-like [Tanacetum cinerariifolium]
MGIMTYTDEYTSSVQPARIFKASIVDSHNLMSNILPDAIKSIEFIKGDGGAGSIKHINFAGGFVKHQIDKLDDKTFAYKYTLIEGIGISDKIEKVSYDIKFEASSDGGTISKMTMTIYTRGDFEIKEEELKAVKEKVLGLYKEWPRRATMHICQAANPRGRQDPPKSKVDCSLGCPPFGSFIMSLEESDNLDILDTELIDSVLEANSLPKFDMHLYKSSLSETHVKWLTKFYGILEDHHPWVVPEGMTMDTIPKDAIGFYAHHFQQGGLRHYDSSVADPFPKPNEFDASAVTKLREVVIVLRKLPPSLLYAAGLSHVWKHAGRAFSLKDPKEKGCKVAAGAFSPPGSARVLDAKEKKKKKAKAKAVANVLDVDIQIEKIAGKRCTGKKGTSRTKRKTDKHVTPRPIVNVKEPVVGEEKDQENVNPNFAKEGHGDNEDRLSGLYQRLESVERPVRNTVVPDAEENTMSNLFTPTDNEFFNEGVCDEFAVKRSWKLLCQSAQQQANTLLRFESLTEEHGKLVYAYESCKDMKKKGLQEKVRKLDKEKVETEEVCMKQANRIKQLEVELKQSKFDTHRLCVDREKFAVEYGNGEMARCKIINEYIPTFMRWLHQSVKYKRSLGKAFCLVSGHPNMDPASYNTFMETYEKLFDKRYPYVDKVARAYLLDPTSLQNVMPD